MGVNLVRGATVDYTSTIAVVRIAVAAASPIVYVHSYYKTQTSTGGLHSG